MVSTQDYYNFISENITQKILETEPFTVSSFNIEPTILDARPMKNVYNGMPEKGQKEYFGFKFKFVYITDLVIQISPENELRTA